MRKLKTAILGLNPQGLDLLEAAVKSDLYDIMAVADKDTSFAEKIAHDYKCKFFDDYRQLIIQNELECLIVAEGLYICDEYVRMAIKNKVNILKVPPPARNLQESAELYRLAERENINFGIADPSSFSKSFLDFRDYWNNKTPENIYLILVSCIFGQTNLPAWQSDPLLAGGGVLLRDSYSIIDLLVETFGIPEQVYSLNTNMAADKKQRKYLTEDIVIASMKFSDATFCNLTATRNVPFDKTEQVIKVYTKDKVVSVNSNRFSIVDSAGKITYESANDCILPELNCKMLAKFAQNISNPEQSPFFKSIKSGLQNMALIEAAYVSSRTGLPEKPGKILSLIPLNFRDI